MLLSPTENGVPEKKKKFIAVFNERNKSEMNEKKTEWKLTVGVKTKVQWGEEN